MTYSATGPSTLTLPGFQTVAYTLHFENTGAEAERVGIVAAVPDLAPPRQGTTLGRSNSFPILTNVVGTTTITGIKTLNITYRNDLPCLRTTAGSGFRDYDLEIPAGASGNIRYEFTVGRLAPRRGESFVPTFVVSGDGTTQRVQPPEPVLLGQRGTDIFVGGWIKKKKRVVITGSTSPPLPAGHPIDLQITGPGTNVPGVVQIPLGTARVNGDGTFTAERKLPRREGTYRIDASYRSQGATLADDSSCGSSLYLPAKPKAKKKKKKKPKRKKKN